jgi:membrane-bound serine protease (ClpP class)
MINISMAVCAFFLFLSISWGSSNMVYIVTVDNAIQPISAQYIIENLNTAERARAELFIIEIDTPGGLGESMRAVIRKMLDSKVPVAVYVAPSGARAASAGFFILMASDIAIMAPGTNTGAAHPIPIMDSGGKEQSEELTKTMLKKMENDSVAAMKSVVEKRGRNVELALKAVTESASFSDQEALKDKLIEFVCKNRDDVLTTLNGKKIKRWNGEETMLELSNPEIQYVPMNRRQRFLSLLADPNITFILLGLAMLGIFFELSNPGLILPGIVGVVALVLFLLSVQIVPVNIAGIVFIVLAIVLFILEAKIHSYGMLALGGIISMIVGGLMLVNVPPEEMHGVSLSVLLPVAIILGMVTVFLLTLVIRTHRTKPYTGEKGLIGLSGIARTPLNLEGKVFVFGELWDARADEEIKEGEAVIITSVEGFKIQVKKK